MTLAESRGQASWAADCYFHGLYQLRPDLLTAKVMPALRRHGRFSRELHGIVSRCLQNAAQFRSFPCRGGKKTISYRK